MVPLRCLANESMSVMQLQLPRRRYARQVTLFENNSYVRLLNLLLQMELGCIELYQTCSTELNNYRLLDIIDCHRLQAKSLVNLIISNRGIPEHKGFAFSSELSLMASRIGRRLPHTLARRTSVASCLQLEKSLRRRYRQALAIAPYRDRIELNAHILSTRQHINHLQTRDEQDSSTIEPS